MIQTRTRIGLLLFTIGLVVCQCSWAANEEVLDEVIAVINQEVITESQVQNEMLDLKTMMEMQRQQNPASAPAPVDNKTLREQAVSRLIDRSLQMQYANKMKITVSNQQVEETIDNIARQNNMDVTQFEGALQAQGISMNEYKTKIRRQLTERDLKQKVLASRVDISDAEVKQALNDPDNPLNFRKRYWVKDYFVAAEQDASDAILQQARLQAREVMRKLRDGHLPASSEAEMIDFGWRRLHELPAVFADAVKVMKKGQTHSALQTANGFHVLQLVDIEQPYQNHQAHEFHLRHILMKPTALLTDNLVKEKLNKIKKETETGGSFAKMARKYSEDYDTAGKGGDMGWQEVSHLPPLFANQLAQLRQGQVSAPFKSEAGWHLLYVEGIREKENSQAMREAETKSWLFQKKVEEESQKWLAKLRENTFIKRTDTIDNAGKAVGKA